MIAMRNALKNIRRTPYQAISAILVLTITFFVAQLFVLLMYGSQTILQYFETQPQVTAFFDNSATPEDINQLKVQVEAMDYVESVRYISKEEALDIYRQQTADDPLLMEMVTADILPASLEVSAKSAEYLPEIQKLFTSAPYVEEVVYHKDVVDALITWTRGLRIAGLTLVIILGITSLLVMTVIISMKVAAKRMEIATMRLLGAKPWYVRGPFVLEGAIYGVVGAVIAWGILYICLLYATPILLDFLRDIPLLPIPVQIMLMLLGGAVGIGALIGMISGSFSSSRHRR